MKRTPVVPVAALVAMALTLVAMPAAAHDYDRDDSDYPLRYIAYALHPVGIALEYGVTRPIHWLVSQPHLRIVFGHDPRNEIDEQGRYPVCPLCKQPPQLVPCPKCHRKLMRPRDEYFVWR